MLTVLARVVAGAGGTVSKVGAPALLHETAHPRLRAQLGYMYFGCYYIGSILSSIMTGKDRICFPRCLPAPC